MIEREEKEKERTYPLQDQKLQRSSSGGMRE
jgi:hypothetical protein